MPFVDLQSDLLSPRPDTLLCRGPQVQAAVRLLLHPSKYCSETSWVQRFTISLMAQCVGFTEGTAILKNNRWGKMSRQLSAAAVCSGVSQVDGYENSHCYRTSCD